MAPSLITAPSSGTGSDSKISAHHPAVMGSAAPLCGPSVQSPVYPCHHSEFKKLSRNLQGFGHSPGWGGHRCFLLLSSPFGIKEGGGTR